MTPIEIIAAAREIVDGKWMFRSEPIPATRDIAAELLRLHDGAEALRAELELWKPMTDEEATAALNAAEAVPMSDERLKEIVAFAIDPANKLPNNEQAQLAADNKRLRAENERLVQRLQEACDQSETILKSSNTEISHLQVERDRLAVELERLKAEQDNSGFIPWRSAQDSIDTLVSERDQLRREVESLNEMIRQYGFGQGEINGWASEHQELKAELAEAKAALATQQRCPWERSLDEICPVHGGPCGQCPIPQRLEAKP